MERVNLLPAPNSQNLYQYCVQNFERIRGVINNLFTNPFKVMGSSSIRSGTGAPSNADGDNGDFYLRNDGGALTTIYHKRAGAWVGVV